MKTVLHVCCGPCASACVPRLKAAGRDVTMFFSNSNIDTSEEFSRRRAAAERLASAEGVPLAADGYDHEAWLSEVAAGFEDEPEGGARCERCFRFNLARAARFADGAGAESFTTSLTVSPHKRSATVFAAGDAAAAGAKAAFLHEDFKKRDGFLESTRRAKALGLYRQSYCGCEFSRRAAQSAAGTGPAAVTAPAGRGTSRT